MKTRNIVLAVALAFGCAGTAWAQSSNTFSNTQTNTGGSGNFGGGFGGGFGFGSFKFTSGATTISQGSSADGSFCQFFSFSAGANSIVQIIQGDAFSQSFGSSASATDPCE